MRKKKQKLTNDYANDGNCKKKKFAVAFTKFSLKTRQVGTFVSLVWNTTNKKKILEPPCSTFLIYILYIFVFVMYISTTMAKKKKNQLLARGVSDL